MRYQWTILQDGQLPLKPDGRMTREQHLCTVTLIWPRGASPSPENSLIVDPCFSGESVAEAERRLEQLAASWDSIGYFFEAHDHLDHALHLPLPASAHRTGHPTRTRTPRWQLWSGDKQVFPDVDLVACPGHAAELQVVMFRGARGVACVTSDAILDLEWLVAWRYYWPNVYEAPEIVDTWRSLVNILSIADTVIPGHGAPIRVTAALLQQLIDDFPRAEYGSRCRDVVSALGRRLESLQ